MHKIWLVICFFLYAACSQKQSGSLYNDNLKGEIQASFVLEKIKQDHSISLQNKTIKGVLDLTSLAQARKRALINSQLTFKDCVFEDSLVAFRLAKQKATFCLFRGDVTFDNCQFDDGFYAKEAFFDLNVQFSQCFFKKTASFEGATFRGQYLLFRDCHFAAEAQFQRIESWGTTDFLRTQFGGIASFAQAICYGKALFASTKFLRYADFSGFSAQRNIAFNYALFYDQAVFSEGAFLNRAEWIKAVFTKAALFESTHFSGAVQMNEAHFKDSLVLRNTFFGKTKPDVSGCRFDEPNKKNKDGAKTVQSLPFSWED